MEANVHPLGNIAPVRPICMFSGMSNGRINLASVGVGPEETLQPAGADWLNCLWAAGSCWVMAGSFITAWWWPGKIDDGRWVKLGVGVLLLEFILIHSGAFLNHVMAQRAGWDRTKTLLGLTVFYTIFALGIALVFKSWWLLGTFVLVMSARLRAVFAGMTALDRAVSQRRVAASALLFLGLTFASVAIRMPPGGLTPALLSEVWPDRKSGIWETHPQQALAVGAVYFLVLGLVEARPPRKWRPPLPN